MRRFGPIAIMYGGRASTALLGLLVLPLLNRLLSASAFGLVAVILSLQALVVMLDLGLAITTGRDIAAAPADAMETRRRIVLHAERVLSVAYVACALIAVVMALIISLPIGPLPILLLVATLWMVTWQNILNVALMAHQDFVLATAFQFGGLLLRHAFSLALVAFWAPTVEAFIIGQVLGALPMLLGLRVIVFRRFAGGDEEAPAPLGLKAINSAVIVQGIAGACALQLDKPIISALASPQQTGPYFLASVLAMVPITFLAAPVSQFFQPKVVAAIAAGRDGDARRLFAQLILAILAAAVVPGFVIAFLATPITAAWLSSHGNQPIVAHLLPILISGTAISALGLIPIMALTAIRDYRFIALVSTLLTLLVLTATALLARQNDMTGICVAYAIYHISAAIILWCRAAILVPSFRSPLRRF
jgi:O-antigen/teichoic acid export membrane protein